MAQTSKMDRRIRRTRTLLANALTELIAEKNIKDITVKELCDAADINRGTFYLHYKDIYDMAAQIEQDILDCFAALLTKHQPNELRLDPYPLLYDIFCFIAENAAICKMLLSPNGDISFLMQIKTLFRECFLNVWNLSSDTTAPAQFDYVYSFIATGSVGLIENWLISDQPESPEEIASLAANIITTGMRSFL